MKNELLFSLFGICFKKEAISTIRMLRSTKNPDPVWYHIPINHFPSPKRYLTLQQNLFSYFFVEINFFVLCLTCHEATPHRGRHCEGLPRPLGRRHLLGLVLLLPHLIHTLLLLWCGGIFFAAHPHPCFPTMAEKEKKVLVLFFCVFPVLRRRQWQQAFLASEVSFPPQSRRCRRGEEKKISTNSGLSFPFLSSFSCVFPFPPEERCWRRWGLAWKKRKQRGTYIYLILFETERLDTRVKFPTLVIAPSAVKKRQKIA